MPLSCSPFASSAPPLAMFTFLSILAAGAPTQGAGGRDVDDAPDSASRAIVAAVNSVVATDIGIPSADVAPCSLDALPSSRAKILPLLPPEHRRLIAECARGRTRLRKDVRGFNLLALLEDPVEATAEAAAIQAFFDERTVDVAIGSGVSGEPYPITFDWVVVLDAEARAVFSFIVNCQD
jgi:hypothetical protein